MTVVADIWMPGAEDPTYEMRFASWEIAQIYVGQYLEMGAMAVVSIVDEPLIPEAPSAPCRPVAGAIH